MSLTPKLLVGFLFLHPLLINAQEKAPLNPGKANQAGQGSHNGKDNREPNKTPATHPQATPDPEQMGGKVAAEDKGQAIRVSAIPRVRVEATKDWTDHSVWISSLLLVVVGIVASNAAFKTLSVIRRQTKAMERQTAAIERQGDALINSERAWVVVSKVWRPHFGVEGDASNGFSFDLMNRGSTVARLTGPFRKRFHLVPITEKLPELPDYEIPPDFFGTVPESPVRRSQGVQQAQIGRK